MINLVLRRLIEIYDLLKRKLDSISVGLTIRGCLTALSSGRTDDKLLALTICPTKKKNRQPKRSKTSTPTSIEEGDCHFRVESGSSTRGARSGSPGFKRDLMEKSREQRATLFCTEGDVIVLFINARKRKL